MCLGLKPRAAGWKVQTNPLSYGGTPVSTLLLIKYVARVVVYSHNNTHYILAIDWLQFTKRFHNILNNFLEKNHLIKILYYLMQESSNHFLFVLLFYCRLCDTDSDPRGLRSQNMRVVVTTELSINRENLSIECFSPSKPFLWLI